MLCSLPVPFSPLPSPIGKTFNKPPHGTKRKTLQTQNGKILGEPRVSHPVYPSVPLPQGVTKRNFPMIAGELQYFIEQLVRLAKFFGLWVFDSPLSIFWESLSTRIHLYPYCQATCKPTYRPIVSYQTLHPSIFSFDPSPCYQCLLNKYSTYAIILF